MSSLREYIASPFEEFYKYRELIRYQIKGELKRRHFHKALGPIWWVGEPLALGVMFVFVTMFLFKDNFAEHHTITIIMGVLVWHWIARTLAGSPNLLLSFRKELTMTNLPLYPLIFTNLLTQLMVFGFSLIVIFVGIFISGVNLTINIVYVPLLIIVQFTMIVGIVPHLAKLGIFFRDIAQVVNVIVGILFFISPIIYQKILVPEEYLMWYNLNPLATLLPAWRDVMINGVQPDLISLGIWFAVFLPLAFWGLNSVAKSRAAYYKRL